MRRAQRKKDTTTPNESTTPHVSKPQPLATLPKPSIPTTMPSKQAISMCGRGESMPV